MTIDKITVNLYTCCKCNYQWTSWNGNGNQRAGSRPILIPKYCPKCKNSRWNQRYLDEELALVNRLQDELYETNLIKKSNDKIEVEGIEILRPKPRTIYPYDYDFISYDFLNEILPQPYFIISDHLKCCSEVVQQKEKLNRKIKRKRKLGLGIVLRPPYLPA
jgi:hypothetical protein